MKTNLVVSLLLAVIPSASADDLRSQLLGRWQYISITDKGVKQPILKGDHVEFSNDDITWQWLGQEHRHLYSVMSTGEYNRIIGYLPSAPEEPAVLAIFSLGNHILLICDRAAELDYPANFDSYEGTLLELRRCETAALSHRTGSLEQGRKRVAQPRIK